MKKRIVFILSVAIIMCFSLFAVSCKKNDNIEEEKKHLFLLKRMGRKSLKKKLIYQTSI